MGCSVALVWASNSNQGGQGLVKGQLCSKCSHLAVIAYTLFLSAFARYPSREGGHLQRGQSGLPHCRHVPVNSNADHSWIIHPTLRLTQLRALKPAYVKPWKRINKCAAALHNQSPAQATPVTWWWVHWGYTIFNLSKGAWLPILTAPVLSYAQKSQPKQKSHTTPQHDRHQDMINNYKLFFGDHSPSDHGDGASVSNRVVAWGIL